MVCIASGIPNVLKVSPTDSPIARAVASSHESIASPLIGATLTGSKIEICRDLSAFRHAQC
jgi:hypothetical protein